MFSLIFVVFFTFSCNAQTDRDQSKFELKTDTLCIEALDSREGSLSKKSRLAQYLESQGLVNIYSLDTTIRVDIKYSSTDNFTKTILYDSLTDAYLHPIAAKKLVDAQRRLRQIDPELSLLIYDAARPLSIQKKMYDVVKDTKYRAYVADPSRIGMHNYAMAVDITICKQNTALDMGTPFDYFGKAAGINNEDELRLQGVLTGDQIKNRKLLRKVMSEAGFTAIRGEWWHFNAISHSEAKKTLQVIE